MVQFEALTAPGATLDDLDLEEAAAYRAALGLPQSESVEQVLLRRGLPEPGNRPWRRMQLAPQLRRPVALRALSPALAAQCHHPGGAFFRGGFRRSLSQTGYCRYAGGPTPPGGSLLLPEPAQRRADGGTGARGNPGIPAEAVRELLVNAVAHRDYNLQGDNIHLNIFADRLEVQSPGGLPGPVNLDNLLEARFSRNAVIVQVLADLGFVERLGYGLDRVVRAVRQAGLRQPKFEEVGGAFRVTLFGESLIPHKAQLQQVAAYQHLN